MLTVQDTELLTSDAEQFARSLEADVADGKVFCAGEQMQIGWMVNLIRSNGEHQLTIDEPDFQSMPIEWKNSVTTTLLHLRLQRSICESYGFGEQGSFPSIRYCALTTSEFDGNAKRIVLERFHAQGADSGWFIGCNESNVDCNDAACLRRISLYELAMVCPRCVPFMALPCGTRVDIANELVTVHYSGTLVRAVAGSLMSLRSGRVLEHSDGA